MCHICVTFGKINRHNVRLSICEICADRCRKDFTSLIGVIQEEFMNKLKSGNSLLSFCTECFVFHFTI
jgi:hypothetical protein